ncbi:hypothetical protein BJX63DRAFT_415732 [Aspergillus granulosus]|uniref:Uncharacterized protein n=1 Tax=Aspergillus granulosus TaxID=176169 RepID=A0ABR4GSX4_9EURO
MIPVYLVGKTFNSNIGWTPQQRAAFSYEEIHQMQITTKLVIAGWFAYVGVLWSLKGAVLIYYHRIMYACKSSVSWPDGFSLLETVGAVSHSKRSSELRPSIAV